MKAKTVMDVLNGHVRMAALAAIAFCAAATCPLSAANAEGGSMRGASAAADYDVIVAGGGPAGIGAGYMAAKRGAKTLVLEKGGRLGGMAVSAMVSPFSFATDSPVVREIAKKVGFGGSVDFHAADVRA